MEKYNKVLGNCGEDAAVKYLKKNKYIVTERNFNVRGGEIDIIAKKGGYVIFVEVKTRTSDDYGGGVVVVTGKMNGEKFSLENIEHIENAF